MNTQKIAIPTNEGMLWPHFGKAPQVTIVTIEGGKVKESVVKQSPEHEHGAIPRFLAAEGCTDVICGGIGGGAVQLLNQLGISLHGGAPTMPVDEIVSRYLAGTMIYGDATCHHDNCGGDHHHHE